MSPDFFAALAIVLGGGIITGIAGFGFALVVVPPLLLLYPPPTVTALAISLTLVTSWIVLLDSWQHVQRSTVQALLPGAIIGLGGGVILLHIASEAWIKLIAGLVVIMFTASLLVHWQIPGVQSRTAPPIAGFFSGALNAATGMASPPIALLFTARGYDLQAFRSSIVTYFYVIDTLAILLLIQQGLVGWKELEVVASLLPAALVGTFIGKRIASRTPEHLFRLVVIGLLFGTGALGIASALIDL